MAKETELDFPRVPSERLKKLVKSLMESGKLKPPTIDEWHLPMSWINPIPLKSKKFKGTRTYSIDYEGSLVFSFREGKLKPIDTQDLSQFFTENYGEAFRAFLEVDKLLLGNGLTNYKLVLRKHLNVYNYNRKTKEWCLVKSESGGLGCNDSPYWDKSNHQDDEGKVIASGWTEKQILKKGDKFTTPYSKGVQTYDPVGLTNIDGEKQTDDRNT
jgi:hypothetical protein